MLAENEIIRNEFNSYQSYTHITWVGTVNAFLSIALRFIKRKLLQHILYEYNSGSY